MDGNNKIIALFVGLFVIILLVGLGLSRLSKSNNKMSGALGNIFNSKTTPTPTVSNKKNIAQVVSVITSYPNNTTTYNQNTPNPSSIPETGASTLPVIVSSFTLGLFLLRYRK